MLMLSIYTKSELSPFHLKEALDEFSLLYASCQHNSSFIWGLLLK